MYAKNPLRLWDSNFPCAIRPIAVAHAVGAEFIRFKSLIFIEGKRSQTC